MTSVLDDPTTIEPRSICDQCGQEDDHPKLFYGFVGRVQRWHHDCTPYKVKAEAIEGLHAVHSLVLAKTFKAAEDGKRGEDLRAFIKGLAMQDHGDATMLYKTAVGDAILDAIYNGGSSGTVTIGALTLTLPFKLKFLSTVSTATTTGTEWSGGSYVAGGVSIAGMFATAAAALAKASTSALSQTNCPATTWADNELADTTGTPVPMAAKGTPSLAVSVSSGSTATIPSGSFTGGQT